MTSRHQNFLSLLLLLIITFPYTQADDEKKTEVVIEAIVYCQSCEHSGTWSLIGANPISSAKVSVTCKNHKDHIVYYKVFETDQNGYLYAPLEGFKMQHSLLDHPLHSCYVKPIWSPLQNCSLLSNVNNGINGATLRYDNKRLRGTKYEAVVYEAGPLAFRPSHCS